MQAIVSYILWFHWKHAGTHLSADCPGSLLPVSALQELEGIRALANHVLHYSLQLPAELERSARFRAERQAAEAQAAAERVAAAVGATQAAT